MFIIVPQVTLPSGEVVPLFQVGQYASSKGGNVRLVHAMKFQNKLARELWKTNGPVKAAVHRIA